MFESLLSFAVRSPEGKLTLFCKGADTIIYERLHPSCNKLMEVTTGHLNVSDAVAFFGCVCRYRTNANTEIVIGFLTCSELSI